MDAIAGPSFGIAYDGSFSFTSKASIDSILHRPAPFTEHQSVFVPSTTDPLVTVSATVIEEPIDPSKDPYVVRFANGDIGEVPTKDIKETTTITPPTIDPIDQTKPCPSLPWIKNNAACTFSHPSLGPKPKWGLLQCDPSKPI